MCSKLRITVDEDPLASREDRFSPIAISNFVRLFPNLARLEVDWSVLSATDGRIRDDLRRYDEQNMRDRVFDNDLVTAPAIISVQFKMHGGKYREAGIRPRESSTFQAIQQYGMSLRHIHMPKMRRLHVTWDFGMCDLVGEIDIGTYFEAISCQGWETMKTLTLCLTMPVSDGVFEETVCVSSSFTHVASLQRFFRQEDALFRAIAFSRLNETYWGEHTIAITLIVQDCLDEWSVLSSFSTAEQAVDGTMDVLAGYWPDRDTFREPSLDEASISSTSTISLALYIQSPFLAGLTLMARFEHTPTTHDHTITDPFRWRNHFSYTLYNPERLTLVSGARDCMLLDINDESDSDYSLNSGDTSPGSDSDSDTNSDTNSTQRLPSSG
jgi:hypothetical protein